MSEELKNQKISITEKAASRLKNIIENEETDTKGIRVTIDTGGCSGMSYKITFESCLLYTSPSPRDTEVSRMPSSA